MKVITHLAALGILWSTRALAQGATLEKMPEALELRFALSAAPPHLRSNATTYLLDPAKGYRVSHQGSNGVSCLVIRSDWQWADRPFRDDVFWPVCYDAEGSKTLLQDYLLAAQLRARGMDVRKVHQEVVKRFGSAASPNPAHTGFGYMITPIHRAFGPTSEVISMNMPHYMLYAPNLKDADIGGNGFSVKYPFMSSSSPGRDDLIIMVVGEAETATILKESKDLIAQLCSYRTYLCTTDATRNLAGHMAGK
ncbi:MAG: hypothetical protein ABJE10_00910 [bacterium]